MSKQSKEKQDKFKYKNFFIFLLIVFFIIALVLLYSRYIGTTGLKVKEYKIIYNNLPNSYHGLKIINMSDLHYGRTVNQKELQHLVNKINLIKPDIVVLTGDLIDKDTILNNETAKIITNELKKINATINKYAILGNHDYKFKEWSSIIKGSNFINLNDTYDVIYNNGYEPILIAGISTNLHGTKAIDEKFKPIQEYIDNSNKKANQDKHPIYSILLIHEPDYIDNINFENFNLILAGHSHNGQVTPPFIGAFVLPEGAKKYYKPYYNINNTDLYISSGVGTSSYNFRLFNRPSIDLYRLANR